jgi:hypothetical protein
MEKEHRRSSMDWNGIYGYPGGCLLALDLLLPPTKHTSKSEKTYKHGCRGLNKVFVFLFSFFF